MNYHGRAMRWIREEKYYDRLASVPEEDITRLEQGEPVDYIIGRCSFLECTIDLSQKPFIPRPETEYWTRNAIDTIKRSEKKSFTCLDMFAGSGCIGVAVLKALPHAFVDFVDSDPASIAQIAINTKLNDIEPRRFRVIASDVFEKIHGSYDYIFANPPYCATTISKRVAHSVKTFEPANALWGGEDGLSSIKRFLKDAKHHLKLKGTIYMEFDDIQKEKVAEIIVEEGYGQWRLRHDQYELPRYVIIQKTLPLTTE